MSPAIRLGGQPQPWDDHPPVTARQGRLGRERVTIDGIPTRAVWSRGEGTPALLLHGWMDNADTWLALLERLAGERRTAIAYDLPGFGTAPPLDDGPVLEQLTDFAAAAVRRVADAAERDVIVAGNSLGGWVALRLAERGDLPLAGVVPIAPAGIRMANLFFTIDRIPAVSRLISMPAPVPPAVVRSVVSRMYRALAFADPAGAQQAVVDRFTHFHGDRATIRRRIEYAKRLRADLARPFDPQAITVPVRALWGELDRLCPVVGAEELREALPDAVVEVLPGVGHTPQIEATEAVVAAITDLAD